MRRTIKIVYNTIVMINLISFILKSVMRSNKKMHTSLIKLYENKAAYERLESERLHTEETTSSAFEDARKRFNI